MPMSPFHLFPLPPEDRHLQERLDQELVELFIRHSKAAVVGVSFVLGALWVILGSKSSSLPELPWLFGCTGVTIAARAAFLVLLGWFPDWNLSTETKRRIRIVIAGITATGLSLSAITLRAFPFLSPAEFALLCICLTGICSIGMQTMAPCPVSYFIFSLVVLGSFGLGMIFHPISSIPSCST
jgi:hypothetical protein